MAGVQTGRIAMRTLWNEGWSFLRLEVGTELSDALGREQDFVPVDIPHDWLIYDADRLYENGTGWYRKNFTWTGDGTKRLFLVFEGIYMDSAVYVNGHKAAEWKYGYSTFTVEITEHVRKGANQILVSACFQAPNSRWYSGAGIYRNVWMKETESICIPENGIYISTRRQQEDFVLRVETAVDVPAVVPAGGEADRDSGGQEVYAVTHRLFYQNREVPMQLIKDERSGREYLVEKPVLWDVEEPALYTLRTCLVCAGEIRQQEECSFGFRYTAFDPDRGFSLNGRHVKLQGVCEHHDLGALGAAFNEAAMVRRLKKLKSMGVNAIRGSHNMMAVRFVELADEMGFLLISEAFDMWERSKNTYDYGRYFAEWHERDVEAWVCRDRNHPSVILWSIGNEIYDTHAGERGQELTGELRELVERYDPWRNARVTIASNYMPWENACKCADLVKIAGYNYSEKYYEEHHRKHPDWVIYGSETSSIVQSRGIYHFPLKAEILAEDDRQCSALGNSITSWGAKSLENCVTVDRDTAFSMGQFLWTGFDYIGEPTPYHTKNSYFGQIDTAGFPKDSYYVWQAAWTDYHEAPMVHVFPYWDFNPGQLIDVRVCSNAPEVELFLNGKSLGRRKLSHAPGSGRTILADYQVPYEEGALTAVAYDEAGREIAGSTRRSFGNSHAVRIYPENTVIKADGKDLLFLEIGTVDERGNPVENACDRVRVQVAGAGRLVGLDNGDSTDYDSYKTDSRRLFGGKLLAMIQSVGEPGEIRVQVSAKGLIGASLLCHSEEVCSGAPTTRNQPCDIRRNADLPVRTGRADEIPVRKITLLTEENRVFGPERKRLSVEARIDPPEADDRELFFRAVDDHGVDSNLVRLVQDGNRAQLEALGDGAFRLRCMSKSGTDAIRLISQLEFEIQGLGKAWLDPYDFISGSQYTSVKGEAGNGNERGVATARDGETVVSYGGIDFGRTGSDQIVMPIFALDSGEYPIQIWEGIPGEADSELIGDVVYQKPSVWNVYQEETFRLQRRVKGITTISFLLRQKMHIKGFSFVRCEKAWMRLPAAGADHLYGDSFRIAGDAVEEIGNNVSLEFAEMDFGEKGAEKLTVWGRAPKGSNTVHVRFFDGNSESKQIVEFPGGDAYAASTFTLLPVKGKVTVTFVFMPGSCFDFQAFQFA
ncbi:MAG: DUF4982 domain-containing protein [Lachnospiraceae bacterium]|nr:DUF4982 domain-containing protein [Lachnospiraceae bacterium]